MVRRFSLLLLLITLLIPTLPLVASTPAGAASWTQWQGTCAKWVLDIPKVDAGIKVDTAQLNFTYLTIDFASLAIDGKHIKACHTSPDRTLNSLLTRFGGALYIAGYRCALWSSAKGRISASPCYGSLLQKKALEAQLNNRMAVLVG
jgi:hypothetical protein